MRSVSEFSKNDSTLTFEWEQSLSLYNSSIVVDHDVPACEPDLFNAETKITRSLWDPTRNWKLVRNTQVLLQISSSDRANNPERREPGLVKIVPVDHTKLHYIKNRIVRMTLTYPGTTMRCFLGSSSKSFENCFEQNSRVTALITKCNLEHTFQKQLNGESLKNGWMEVGR